MNKKILLFLLMLMPLVASADDSGTCGNNLTWSYVDATKTLTISGTGPMTDYHYLASAPWFNYSIKYAIIESGVASIGEWAFDCRAELTSLTIPSSVTSIGVRAFNDCWGLTSITIPSSVTSIGSGAFAFCSGLNTIVSEIENPYAIDESIFPDYETVPLIVPPGKKSAYQNTAGWNKFTNIVEAGQGGEIGCIFETDGIRYKIGKNNTVSVVSREAKYFGDVILPGSVEFNGKTYIVTAISDNAFNGCSGLTSVTIPNSVISIGCCAFRFCSALTSVTISNSVTTIGDSAFDGCSGLTSVTIPNSVISIGSSAFERCSGLTSITIPNSVTFIGGEAFCDCSNLSTINFGDNINIIGWAAFNGTAWFNNQPDGLVYIGKIAYKYKGEMPSNTIIIIKEGTITIGAAFGNDYSGLTSITIPNSVKAIIGSAFSGCSGLTTIVSEIENPFAIDESVFSCFKKDIYTTATLIVPPGKKSAYKNTAGWNKFQNIVEAELVGYKFENNGIRYKIGENNTASVVSRDAKYSGDIVIPSHVSYNGSNYDITSIGESAFSDCSGLTSLTLPNSVTSIGNSAFLDCSGLTSLTLPNSITTIGGWAFCGCSGLTSLTLPNSITTIGEFTFHGCSGLTSLTLPNSVTSIGEAAFRICSGLTSLTLPNSVTSIGGGAFRGCSGLTTIVSKIENPFAISVAFDKDIYPYDKDPYATATLIVPPGKKSAYQNTTGWNKFQNIVETGQGGIIGCEFEDNGIRYKIGENNTVSVVSRDAKYSGDVVIPSQVSYNGSNYNVTSIGSSAFEGCVDMTSVSIPGSVTTIGGAAFYYCTGLTTVDIPNGVMEIGEGAFSKCGGLTSVTIPGTVTVIESNAFFQCYGLTQITSWIENPFTINSNVFPTSVYSNAALNVPSGKKTVYQNTSGWKKFENMSESSKCAKPTISYSNGKISFSCETEGVEFHYTISNTNSSTGVGSSVNFSPTVNISVYASKSGFANSDTSTTEIVVPAGLRGDLTGDGQVNVADHVELSKIILGQ